MDHNGHGFGAHHSGSDWHTGDHHSGANRHSDERRSLLDAPQTTLEHMSDVAASFTVPRVDESKIIALPRSAFIGSAALRTMSSPRG